MTAVLDREGTGGARAGGQIVRAPLYRQLADLLRTQLRCGRYPPGDMLPSAGALAQQHRISRPTVRQALAQLAAEGWIEVVNGKGNYALPTPHGLQPDPGSQATP